MLKHRFNSVFPYFLIISINALFPAIHSTPPSYLDPWMYLGYGLDFPNNNFPLDNWDNYYKESRVSWIWFIYIFYKVFGTSFTFYLSVFVISITYASLNRLFSSNVIASRYVTLLISCSPLFYSSGGFLYHNTFINLMLSIILSLSLKPFKNIYFNTASLAICVASTIIVNPLVIVPVFLILSVYFLKFKLYQINKFVHIVIGIFTLENTFLFFSFLNEYVNRPFKFWEPQLNLLLNSSDVVGSYWAPLNLDMILNFKFVFFIFMTFIFSAFMIILKKNVLINFFLILSFGYFLILHQLGNPIFNSEYMINPLSFLSIIVFVLNLTHAVDQGDFNKIAYASVIYVLILFLKFNILLLFIISLIIFIVFFMFRFNLLKSGFFHLLSFAFLFSFLALPPSGPYQLFENCDIRQKYLDTVTNLQLRFRDEIGVSNKVAVWGDPSQTIDFECNPNLELSNFADTSAQMGLAYLTTPFPQKDITSPEFMVGINNYSTAGDTIVLFVSETNLMAVFEILPNNYKKIEIRKIPFSVSGKMIVLKY